MKLVEISRWSDDEVMAASTVGFAELLRGRAWQYACDLYDPNAWTCVSLEPETYDQELGYYLRRRAWAEWYFGTVTLARQISLMGESDAAIELRLARQISDEVRHHDTFAAAARKLGAEWRVERFPKPANLVNMQQTHVEANTAGELAAANQLAGEVVLLIHGQRKDNVLFQLVPEDVQALMEDIEGDEPAHVELGAELVARHATGPVHRRAMAMVQERYLVALGAQHRAEIQRLGAHRHRALASFEIEELSS